MQLNALFCCFWHNVEASCHKHFFVVSCYQHRCLLPAISVTAGGPASSYWQHLAGSSVNITQWSQIGSESLFLPSPPAFNSPIGKTRMAWLPDGEKNLKICLFVLTECTIVTHRRTDTTWRLRPRLHSIAHRQKLIKVNCRAIFRCPGPGRAG